MRRHNRRLLAVLLAVALFATALAPLGAAQDGGDASMSIDVSTDAEPTVTVLDGDEAPIENASVNVTLADGESNASYEGTGDYETDANGTVELPTPNETVSVAVTVTAGNESIETTAALEADADDEIDDDPDHFGSIVSDFVHQSQNESTPGLTIAAFVTAHNPGSAPDHAGPPGDADRATEANGSGPPDHAGLPSDDESESDDGDDDEDDDDEQRGPPDRAGPPSDDRP